RGARLYCRRSKSGSLAKLAATRRASSLVSSLAGAHSRDPGGMALHLEDVKKDSAAHLSDGVCVLTVQEVQIIGRLLRGRAGAAFSQWRMRLSCSHNDRLSTFATSSHDNVPP